MMSSGGYTTINDDNHASNNVVSGSVPAVSGPDHVTIKFAESNLQTFPPSSDSHGKISAVFRPPSDADDTFSKPVHRGSEEPQPTGWMHAFTVGAYKPYFDVDTSDVLERIKESFFPFRGTFTEKTSDNPDLYGPFWICTTLIFVAAAIGTFVTYVAHKLQKKEWNYDINLVTWSAGLFYGYVTLVPLGLYVILKYFSVPSGLVQLWCLYGYSLFVFIPASAMLASHCLWCRIAVTIGARLCHCQPSSTPPLSSSPKPVALHLDDPRPTYLLMLLNHKGIYKSNPACNCCLCLCYFSSTTLPSSIP